MTDIFPDGDEMGPGMHTIYPDLPPRIEVRIAFTPDALIGAEYNRLIRQGDSPWVLLLDHDVFLCNPHWHLLCREAIKQHPTAGLFTCKCNNVALTGQLDRTAPRSHDLQAHRQHARQVFNRHGFRCTPISKASGFFMLINRAAWQDVGGFRETGFFDVDWDFSRRLHAQHWSIFCINGLYVYHLRDTEDGSWIETERTSLEIWRELKASPSSRRPHPLEAGCSERVTKC